MPMEEPQRSEHRRRQMPKEESRQAEHSCPRRSRSRRGPGSRSGCCPMLIVVWTQVSSKDLSDQTCEV